MGVVMCRALFWAESCLFFSCRFVVIDRYCPCSLCFGLFWSAYCPVIELRYFTCTYLWNGMLIAWTRRLKHRRNGGKRSRRWGNIYGAWPHVTPPPSSVKRKSMFLSMQSLICTNSEGCVLLKWPKGMETAREEEQEEEEIGDAVQELFMFGSFFLCSCLVVALRDIRLR